ncbi:MAG: SemiSWEET transporter [Magnetococcales bacterium]|nr:SemiSWEET transporter [Magnetococcales bacterium]
MNSSLAIEWLGYLAGGLTAASFLPQVIRTWRTRSAADLSLGMLTLYLSSTVLWLVYGWLAKAWPVLATNIAIFFLAGMILGMKLTFGK